MINQVSNLLKILSGRKLTQRQMDLAQSRERIDPCTGWEWNKEGFTGNIDNLFVKDGKIIRQIEKFRYATTPDFSHPHIRHSMHYSVKSDKRIYSEEGLLEEREVWTGEPSGEILSNKHLVYQPAGRLIGRRVK